jgi:hypothetical protein
MAIGRVAGPMLLSTLDRQGIDLNFVTDPGTGSQTLVYLDFSNFRMGVNTSATTERLTVEGNISVNSYIKTTSVNQHLHIQPDGTGQVIISNVNVLKGNINATDIGTITAAAAKFTTANTSAKLTAATARVENLTPGRIVFSDGVGLNDDSELLFFTSNNTFYATTIESAGTVGYANLNITGEFNYTFGTSTYVPYFAANNMLYVDPGIRYFESNVTFRANNIQIGTAGAGRILYTNASNSAVASASLTYDGSTFISAGITRLGNTQVINQTISGINVDQDLVFNPDGLGSVNVNFHRVVNVDAPVNDTDAATKQYVDDRVSVSNTNRIFQASSEVVVVDNGLGTADVRINVNNGLAARFTDTFSFIGDLSIYDNILNSTAGELILNPALTNRLRIDTTSSVLVPVGLSAERPPIPVIGDMRFNSELGTLEWYSGTEWDNASAPNTVSSQIIIPDGVSSTFTLNQGATTDTIFVTINGVVQAPTTAYTVTGTSLNLIDVPLVSDTLEIRFLAAGIAFASNPTFINTLFSTVSTGSTTLDTFSIAQYRSAIYDFTVKNTTTSQYQIGEIYLVHNNITANVTYTTKTRIGTQTDLVTWAATIDGLGVVRLRATAVSGTGTTQAKIGRTYFNDQ